MLYQCLMGTRNWMYDRGLFKAHKVGVPVISIGNLTVGGTGKTPTAMAVVDYLKSQAYTCAVISRGYKRQKKGVLEVTTGKDAAVTFGDEPALIKFTFPDIPVVVAEKRAQGAKAVLEKHKVDFLICDDAFQHRSLHRDLNILLFDATENMKNYRVMPFGRAREKIGPALKRADVIIVTKANLVSPDAAADLEHWLKNHAEKPVILSEYVFKGLRNLQGERKDSLKDTAVVVSGVAKPETVERMLEGRVKTVKHKKFDDHHRYTNLEVDTLLDEASALQARWIVTTGKDAMKLGAFNQLRDRLWVADLGVEWKGEVQALYEAIDRLAGSGR